MKSKNEKFDEAMSISLIRHYLPQQAALKDFIHHNTLHAFQDKKFHDALYYASQMLGYKTYISIDEYREFYFNGKIKKEILEKILSDKFLDEYNKSNRYFDFKDKLLQNTFSEKITSNVGKLRSFWKTKSKINLDKMTHPILFRILAAYLDQGISIWKFPIIEEGFLKSIQALEASNKISIFKSKRAKKLLLDSSTNLIQLLEIIVGDDSLFEQYIFDQQFSHPGWSGMVSIIESNPNTLLNHRVISLKELILFELLLEIDALDSKLGDDWLPLSNYDTMNMKSIFDVTENNDLKEVLSIWQEALEMSYFDDVLLGISQSPNETTKQKLNFQALFCIDDREYSLQRHIKITEPNCETYGTPGFFGVAFYYKPENGQFYTKACPAPVNPLHLIQESERNDYHKHDIYFGNNSHSLFSGWLISQTLGVWSAVKLFANIFKPSLSQAAANSFSHMSKHSKLSIDFKGEYYKGLQVGFTIEEMAERVKNVLYSIGLVKDFAPLVYVVGHGASSINNTHYAGYDCGACSGRPGSVNARVFAYMANKQEVRKILEQYEIHIPTTTFFVGALHDTTRDEIQFYDEEIIPISLFDLHESNSSTFQKSLELNAKERSYRFGMINQNQENYKIHEEVKLRSVSLFEPRPEWNHAANALCIIGRNTLYENIYLDKRPFINSYNYNIDTTGEYLLAILSAAIPVCGGINLEYYFSRVDQLKLGANTKLSHNVVGLFAVANGVDGDLRPGLPSQMIEIHDPVRILFIIEQYPEIVEKVIKTKPEIYNWVENEWVLMAIKVPNSPKILFYKNGGFSDYEPISKNLKKLTDIDSILQNFKTDDSVYTLN